MNLATGLVWLRADGTVLASRTFPGAISDLRASIALGPDGDITLFVVIEIEQTLMHSDFGGGRISGATLVRLSATGTFLWQRLVDALYPASRVTVDRSGNAAVATVNLYGEDDRFYFLHRLPTALAPGRSARTPPMGSRRSPLLRTGASTSRRGPGCGRSSTRPARCCGRGRSRTVRTAT
jgi:hypothetical protein